MYVYACFVVQAAPQPSSVNVAMLAVNDFAGCVSILQQAKQQLGEILSAVEFVDGATMDVCVEHLNLAYPFACKPNFYMILETHGSNETHDQEKLHGLLERLLNAPSSSGGSGTAGVVRDGIVAADSKQAKYLWRLREDAATACSKRGHVYKYDLSFRIPDMYSVVETMRSRLLRWRSSHDVRVVGYGHLGDGNIHLNISTPTRNQPYHRELLADIEPYVFDWTLGEKGSVSAEHGLGQAKAKLLPKARTPAVNALMHALKRQLDPNGILNPGKVLA